MEYTDITQFDSWLREAEGLVLSEQRLREGRDRGARFIVHTLRKLYQRADLPTEMTHRYRHQYLPEYETVPFAKDVLWRYADIDITVIDSAPWRWLPEPLARYLRSHWEAGSSLRLAIGFEEKTFLIKQYYILRLQAGSNVPLCWVEAEEVTLGPATAHAFLEAEDRLKRYLGFRPQWESIDGTYELERLLFIGRLVRFAQVLVEMAAGAG